MTLLVTWLWQGLAIAWITAAAVRAMPRLNAATRHAIWWLALAAVLIIPIAHELAAMSSGTPSLRDLTPVDAAGALMLPAVPGWLVAGAAALWAIVAFVRLLRIAQSCRTLARLKRAASPFDRSREARLPLWIAGRARRRRPSELRIADGVTGACALGLGRPVILISRPVADALSDESLDEIVMHEQAHLDRYDDWSQLLLAAVSSLVGLHPAVRFLSRRLDVDREAACDDRVVSCTGAARRYAAALLAVAAASCRQAGRIECAAGGPAATTTASALRIRVGRLLDPRRTRGARLAGATSLVSVAGLAIAVVLSTQVAPAVVFFDLAEADAPLAEPAAALRTRLDPAPSTNEAPVAEAPPAAPYRTPVRLPRPARPEPPALAGLPLAVTMVDAPAVAPLDSRTVAAADSKTSGNGSIVKAPAIAVPLPSRPLAVLPPAPDHAAPWDAVTTSTLSAADAVARSAAATGARARSAGISIGRFVTRASKAGANIF
ncbi:MAG: M56 family metallopeptidase [Acidobacteriota bacterium]